MPGNVEHREFGAQLGDLYMIAFGHRIRERRNRLVLRTVHGARVTSKDFGDAAHMVRVMVRGKDGRQLQVFGGKVIEDRLRFARIDDGSVGRIAQRPDIVVLERLQRNDFHLIHLCLL